MTDKPKLSLWMVLIPVIFIFPLNDLQKDQDSRKAIAENFMITSWRALAESMKEAADILITIARQSEEIRRKTAEEIFG